MGRYKNSGNGIGTRGNPQQSLNQENFSSKNIETSSLMPNYDKATIDDNKFLKYSLDIDSERGKDKAIAYKLGLGYDKNNFASLKQQIINEVNNGNAHLIKIQKTEYGMRYTYEIPIKGINGKTKVVVAVYQIDKDGNGIPRLITNHLKKKGK